MTAGLLTLVQWLSPAFPVGGFAYSHGLEWAVAEAGLRDRPAVQGWIGALLAHGAGRTDAILLVQALQPGADLAALADLAAALAPSRERLAETMEQGAAFVRTTNAISGAAHPAMPLPVAVGAAAAGLGLPATQVAALYLQAFAANLVQVAVRFVPLGQTEGQAMLAELQPLVLRIAAEAAETPLEEIGSACLRADLGAMRHETMDVRIYRT